MNVVTQVGQAKQGGVKGKLGPFQWDDALLFNDQLTEDERAIRDAAHAYCQDKLLSARAGSQPPRDVRP